MGKFFDNKEDLKEQKNTSWKERSPFFHGLQRSDKFQHWVYENPNHSIEEKNSSSMDAELNEFSTDTIDFTGLEQFRKWCLA